jgi:hypothetical protein
VSNTPKDPKDQSAKPLKTKTLAPKGSGGRTTKLRTSRRDPRRRGG